MLPGSEFAAGRAEAGAAEKRFTAVEATVEFVAALAASCGFSAWRKNPRKRPAKGILTESAIMIAIFFAPPHRRASSLSGIRANDFPSGIALFCCGACLRLGLKRRKLSRLQRELQVGTKIALPTSAGLPV